jgi:hypothetical protein
MLPQAPIYSLIYVFKGKLADSILLPKDIRPPKADDVQRFT